MPCQGRGAFYVRIGENMGKAMETKSTYKDSNRDKYKKQRPGKKSNNSQSIEDHEEKWEIYKDGERKGFQGCWGTGGNGGES